MNLEESKTLPKEWSIYIDESKSVQEISSAKTARCQKPRTLKIVKVMEFEKEPLLLDVGCGKGNILYKQALEAAGFDYNGCDPFNKSREENLKSIEKCMNGKTDVVTLNNVLNTISQKEVRTSILNQCRNAVNPKTGVLFVLIYEGTLSKKEKELGMTLAEMTAIKTRDGWQNRKKTEFYVQEIEEVFKNVIIKSIGNTKLIVASENTTVDLISEMNTLNKKLKKSKICKLEIV